MKENINTKKGKVKKRRPSLFTIIFIAIIICVIVGIICGIRYLVIYLKYKPYTDKMYEYGFEKLYSNEMATSNETATNLDVIKVVIGSLKNKSDIDDIYYFENDSISNNLKWYQYATELGFNTRIKKDELNAKANNIDTVLFVTNVVEKMLGKEIQPVILNMSESKLAAFSDSNIDTIKKAVALELIENNNSGLSNKTLIKGELNKLVITIVEKYSTLYYENEFLANSDSQTAKGNIVTDNSKKPTNYKDYPYIVDNISNDIYETSFKEYTMSELQTPKEVYSYMKDLYMQIDELVTNYLDLVLNVDYETITVENFLNNIDNKVLYGITQDDVREYVNYVKEHKIKLEGSAEPLLPIIYYVDGEYLIRTKITFKVINSDTKYNLLFGDENNSVKYNDKEYTLYVDYPTGMTFNSYSLRAKISCVASNIISSNNIIQIEK